ncbi:hypothetical protein D3C77_546470 [compost metagenome]
MTGIILFIVVCKNYASNIKAYSRRLLPIRPVWAAVSSIVLGWIAAASIGILVVVHCFLYFNIVTVPAWWPIEFNMIGIKDIAALLFVVGWALTFLVMTILLSMTIGASVSLRGKAGTWVGILAFFLIQNVLSWVEHLLFRQYDGMMLRIGSVQMSNDGLSAEMMSNTPILSLGPLLFEAAIFALMLFVTNYLMSKKVEI